MVKKGISLKAIGNFVGTSVTIIEQYYSAKLELHPDQSDEQELFEKSADKLQKSLAFPTEFELETVNFDDASKEVEVIDISKLKKV